MESVRSAFHAQLATVMDSLLAAAVCEIAKIFESSLCEQQAELAQKTEEISILRCKLEKVERRQKAKGGGSEEGDMSGDREGILRQQTLTGSGLNMGKDVSSHSNPVEGLNQNLGRLKEEVKSQDGASVKHERAGSRPGLGSVTVQVPEGSLAAGNQTQINVLSTTEAKTKCNKYLTGIKAVVVQTTDPFRIRPLPHFSPSLRVDVAPPDLTLTWLKQEPENQNSNQNAVQGQGVGERGARQEQSQATPGESLWRPRDERGGRATMNHARRVTNFGNRDPLRPQSNSQLLTLRHTNTLSHPPATGGGNGRPYTCPYCTKCFTYPSHQRRHLLRHTGVRLHPCQFCEKSFLTPSELTVHTRTHTGERPFGCSQCGKRFARSGNLRAHQRDVHMGKRPFACTECGKRFAHRGNLRVHNHRVHQGDPYYMDDQQEPDIGSNPI